MAVDSVDDLKGDIKIQQSEQTTTFTSRMAVNVSNVKIREWFQRQRDSIHPWSEFVNSKKFGLPKSVAHAGKRILKNVNNMQSNYLFVFLGLLLFCLLTSPVLLIALAACLGACYIISLKNAEKRITVMGKELSLAQQYAAVGVLSFPLFWFAGAGSAVFWVIGASFLSIFLHALMYSGGDEVEPFVDLEMETV